MHSQPQLIAADQHRARAQAAHVLQDLEVVVGLHRIAGQAGQAGERLLVGGIVGADAVLAVQVEGALGRLWGRG